MNFYRALSRYYNDIFPIQSNILKFIDSEFKIEDTILDLACGTGNYSIEIAKRNKNVFATDLCEEMIRIGKESQKKYTVEFFNEDIRNINVVFKDIRFDGIFCIGNSLVHLDSKWDIQDVSKKVYERLKEKGVFIIGIINYDRIIKNNIKELPIIKNKDQDLIFIREYDYVDNGEKLHFNSTIIMGDSKEIIKNQIEIIPLNREEIYDILKNTGFSRIEVYGDYLGSPWNDNAYNTIIKAYK